MCNFIYIGIGSGTDTVQVVDGEVRTALDCTNTRESLVILVPSGESAEPINNITTGGLWHLTVLFDSDHHLILGYQVSVPKTVARSV